MASIYEIFLKAIALYCAVPVNVLKNFMAAPFNDKFDLQEIKDICVYSLFLNNL